MKQILTTAIVLARTEFAEADRIVTLLTPDSGKLRAIAKGVRRPNSKLAGGIELFSVSNISYMVGRGELGTIVSTRLITHYGNIVKDIQKTMLGYDLLKRLNRATEDAAGEEYFMIAKGAFEGLNDDDLVIELTELWFTMQMLSVSGHLPNLRTDSAGQTLQADDSYIFDFDHMTFESQDNGPFTSNHIKLLRLAYSVEEPVALKRIMGSQKSAVEALGLVKTMLSRLVRI